MPIELLRLIFSIKSVAIELKNSTVRSEIAYLFIYYIIDSFSRSEVVNRVPNTNFLDKLNWTINIQLIRLIEPKVNMVMRDFSLNPGNLNIFSLYRDRAKKVCTKMMNFWIYFYSTAKIRLKSTRKLICEDEKIFNSAV